MRARRNHRVGKVDAGQLDGAVYLEAAHREVPPRDRLLKIRAVGHIDGRLQRPRIAQQLAIRPRHTNVDVGSVERQHFGQVAPALGGGGVEHLRNGGQLLQKLAGVLVQALPGAGY